MVSNETINNFAVLLSSSPDRKMNSPILFSRKMGRKLANKLLNNPGVTYMKLSLTVQTNVIPICCQINLNRQIRIEHYSFHSTLSFIKSRNNSKYTVIVPDILIINKAFDKVTLSLITIREIEHYAIARFI